MIFNRKTRFKPLYKKFISLHENVQNRKKIFKFKKKKWVKFIGYLTKRSKFYNKFKPIGQTQYVASQYPNRWDSYKKGRYRSTLQVYKRFKLLYGDFNQKTIKKSIKQVLTAKTSLLNIPFLKIFESRLDTVLVRAKFIKSMRSARQYISHGQILVNNKKIKSKNYFLKPGDLISINYKYHNLIKKNLKSLTIWPIPPRHLYINYRTLQIILGTLDTDSDISHYFTFNLKLEKLLLNYYRF